MKSFPKIANIELILPLLILWAHHLPTASAFFSATANTPQQSSTVTTIHTPHDPHLIMGPCPVTRCASTVSKCLITDACRCRPPQPPATDCPCCVRCARCLGSLFSQCCGCVDMCALVNDTADAAAAAAAATSAPPGLRLTRDSQTSDVRQPVPGLFAAVIEREDAGWTTLTYPVGADPLRLPQTDEWDMVVLAADVTAAARPNRTEGSSVTHETKAGDGRWRQRNDANLCSVAYAVQCMSLRRCRLHCAEMGASSVRWFYDGCCECVGPHCRGYGVDESRCEDCPMQKTPEVGVNGVLGAIPTTVREALAATAASSRMWPVREPEEEEALYAVYGLDEDEDGDGADAERETDDEDNDGTEGQPSFVGDTDEHYEDYDEEGDDEDDDEYGDEDDEEDEEDEDEDPVDYEELPDEMVSKTETDDNGDEDYVIPSNAANALDETDYGAMLAPEKRAGSSSSSSTGSSSGSENAVEYDDYALPMADSIRNVLVV